MLPKINKHESGQPDYKLRRRIGAIALALIATAGTVSGFMVARKSKAEGLDGAQIYREYVVQPGDSEWSIADAAYPNDDPRKHIDEIEAQMPEDTDHIGRLIQPGDVIKLADKAKIGHLKTEAPNGS